ncbi:hypothetical protein T06_14298 [Trichinella sp. T6]|nr:hypothetical protein T06_14298 [Trichinella sp. T6]
MALTFDSLAEDGGRQRAMSLRLPGSDVNSFGGWFPSVSLNALRRLSSTARSEQLSSSLEKPRKRSRISLVIVKCLQHQTHMPNDVNARHYYSLCKKHFTNCTWVGVVGWEPFCPPNQSK